jgi:ribosomal protein S13
MSFQNSSAFLNQHWGDIASVVGVFVSVIGFCITIWGVLRSKSAAQKAKEEVLKVRESISNMDTVMEFSAAVTVMDEIKRLHRAAAWAILPDRYSALKRLLISIKANNSDLSDEHKTALQSAIQNFTDIEKRVERTLSSEAEVPSVPALNAIVSTQLDRLFEVLASIRQVQGVE